MPLSRITVNRRHSSLLAVLSLLQAWCAVCVLVLPCLGQLPRDTRLTYDTAPGTGVLVFSIFSEKSGTSLDREGMVKLVRAYDQLAVWQTTGTSSLSVFTNLALGDYEVEVSAVGYLSTKQNVRVMRSLESIRVEIVLHRDPTAVNLDIATTILSPKARKEAKRAISLLKSGKLKGAEKHLDAAYAFAPASSELNFLLGYLWVQKGDFTKAVSYLSAAAKLATNSPQVLSLLGRALLETRQYPDARSVLEQAVLVDANNWLSHELLATAYLYDNNSERARDEAQIALRKGQKIGPKTVAPAQLILGEALVRLGQNEEGLQALKVFLRDLPHDPVAPNVRAMVAEIEQGPAKNAGDHSNANLAGTTPVNPRFPLPSAALASETWHAPSIDDVQPTLATGTVCPAEKVIDEAGNRVQQLVQDLSRFAAVEDLFHQLLDPAGMPVRSETRKYDYVAAFSDSGQGPVFINEYRSASPDAETYPDRIASSGFIALALVFQPELRKDFDLDCQGLTDWQGHAAWLVRFRQRDDRPNRMHSYTIGKQIFFVNLRGRAWVSADTFQIARIEADITKPVPEIQLVSEHQIVDYGPVPFPKKNISLWLPQKAEIYLQFRKHNYYRRHSFDHYMLFSVDAQEHAKAPTGKPSTQENSPQ